MNTTVHLYIKDPKVVVQVRRLHSDAAPYAVLEIEESGSSAVIFTKDGKAQDLANLLRNAAEKIEQKLKVVQGKEVAS